MTLSINNTGQSGFCKSLLELGEKPADQAELLIAYGGARPEEIQWMLSQRHPASRVFWITSGAPLLSGELQEGILSGRMAHVAVEGDVIGEFFSFFQPKENLEFILLDAGRVSSEQHDLQKKILIDLREQIRQSVFNTGTMVTKGPLWQGNTLRNLSLILKRPGVEVLSGVFSGRPAVVVGAGPSLDRSLLSLKRVHDRFVVISTGTAVAPLLAAGIRPDLVVAVDGSPLLARQFACACDDLYLVSSTLVYSGITRLCKGNFFGLINISPIDQWVASVSEVRGLLYPGGTVTASGMGLAVSMGCDPVVCIGLDLAFESDGPSHAAGTMYDNNPTRSSMELVPGNYEQQVYTTRQFRCYIESVGKLVALYPSVRFVNATDCGARISGMELAPPSFLDEWTGPSFDAYEVVEKCHCPPEGGGFSDVFDELMSIAVYLDRIQTGCRNAAMAINRLRLMERRPRSVDREEMARCLDVIHELDELLESGHKQCEFLKMSLWPAAYTLAEGGLGTSEGIDKGLIRSFYEQIAGAAKWTRQIVLQACLELKHETNKGVESSKGENNG